MKIPTIVHIIETIDKLYRDSKDRKKIYKIHDYRYRTLIASNGTITFKTTYYSRKINDGILNSHYCYILDLLNIPSKARMTDEAHSKLLNDTLEFNASKAAKMLGVSKMTASNKIRTIKMNSRHIEKSKSNPDTLYIEADEKWIKKQYGASFNGRTPSTMVVNDTIKVVLIQLG